MCAHCVLQQAFNARKYTFVSCLCFQEALQCSVQFDFGDFFFLLITNYIHDTNIRWRINKPTATTKPQTDAEKPLSTRSGKEKVIGLSEWLASLNLVECT